MTTDEQLRKQNQTCLEAFVLRARRVEAHSLVADLRQVLAWASHNGVLERTPDGRTYISHQLPQEELLESLTARVRPLILDDDPIHYGKVLGAIGFLLTDEDRVTEKSTIKELRKGWSRVRPDYAEIGAYSAQVTDVSTGVTSEHLTSNRLAYAWIYGDTVHADAARQAQAEQFGIKERYRAAAGLVAEIVFRTIALLNYVRALHSNGKLDLPQSVLDKEVIVSQTVFRDEAQIYVAEAGTEPQFPLTGKPGPEWRQVTDPGELTADGGDEASSDPAPMTVEIRPSSVSEQQVRQLIGAPATESLPSQIEAEFTPPRGAFFAAWAGSEAIGCVGVRRRTETEGEINLLTVTPEAQGSPLGPHLLQTAEEAAQHLGYTSVRIDATGSSDTALAHLRDNGYHEPSDNLDDSDALWFQKSLAND